MTYFFTLFVGVILGIIPLKLLPKIQHQINNPRSKTEAKQLGHASFHEKRIDEYTTELINTFTSAEFIAGHVSRLLSSIALDFDKEPTKTTVKCHLIPENLYPMSLQQFEQTCHLFNDRVVDLITTRVIEELERLGYYVRFTDTTSIYFPQHPPRVFTISIHPIPLDKQ